MRSSMFNLFAVFLVASVYTASAQDFRPPHGQGEGQDQFGRGPRGSRELKFDANEDLSLFSSKEELESFNTKLVELKKTNSEAFNQMEKSLMEKMRPSNGGERPSPESMKAKREEMQKELKNWVELNSAPVEREKVVAIPEIKPLPIAKTIAPLPVAIKIPEKLTVVKLDVPNEEEEVVISEEEIIPTPSEVVTESTRNYKPETCVWAEDIPRKIVVGSSCSIEGSRICVGYVVCEQKEGGGKFTRMSTCSEGLCGDADAAACTRQAGFGSFKPKPKSAEFASKKIQDVLKNTARGE